jgi:protocatechuate 3,4-dioxygenase beta subunit
MPHLGTFLQEAGMPDAPIDQDPDKEVATVIGRRAVLALLGSTIVAGFARAQVKPLPSSGRRPLCVVTPEQTEGPYFIDHQLNRSDLRTDPSSGVVKAGVPLSLKLTVSTIGSAGCLPLQGAVVDVWHCDAAGAYSFEGGASSAGQTRGANAERPFLRGYQVTGADGSVQFSTIYPGWYPGRAVHVHFKIRTPLASGRRHEFVSQLYFDNAVTSKIHSRKPYAIPGRQALKNEEDGLFRRDGGQQLMLPVSEVGNGVATSFDIVLQTG